jgi:hypothetical protein
LGVGLIIAFGRSHLTLITNFRASLFLDLHFFSAVKQTNKIPPPNLLKLDLWLRLKLYMLDSSTFRCWVLLKTFD